MIAILRMTQAAAGGPDFESGAPEKIPSRVKKTDGEFEPGGDKGRIDHDSWRGSKDTPATGRNIN